MTPEQLKALIDFIGAKASEVVHNDVGLGGSSYAWSFSWECEKDLYKAFGLDYPLKNP